MKKEVFVVTQGHYSDYHICAIFSDKFRAEEYIQNHDIGGPCNKMEIETWTLDQLVAPSRGLKRFMTWIDQDGKAEAEVWHEYGDDDIAFCGKHMRSYMWATDEQHAIKIANERRAQLIAENRWGEGKDTSEKKMVSI